MDATTTQAAKRINIPQDLRVVVALRDNLTCAWCGRTGLVFGDAAELGSDKTIDVDHVRCVAHGGRNRAANLVTSCAECNRRRQHTPARIWARECARTSEGNVRLDSDVDVDALDAIKARLQQRRQGVKSRKAAVRETRLALQNAAGARRVRTSAILAACLREGV